MGSIRIRVAVLVVRGGDILLVRHEKNGNSYWLLPGGGLEYGECMLDAVKREVKEETGLDVDVGEVVLIWESLPPDGSRHGVNICFRSSVTGGELRTQTDDRLREAAWVPLATLHTISMHPPLVDPITAILGGMQTPLFLGPHWAE